MFILRGVGRIGGLITSTSIVIVPLFVLFTLATFNLVGNHLSGAPEEYAPTGYTAYDAGEEAETSDSPLVTACLLARGYHGDPTDGQEWIYAPESTINACTTEAEDFRNGVSA